MDTKSSLKAKVERALDERSFGELTNDELYLCSVTRQQVLDVYSGHSGATERVLATLWHWYLEATASKDTIPSPSSERENGPDTDPTVEVKKWGNEKAYPVQEGVLDYFPDAIREVARLSLLAQQKHHPGQPLHWDQTKSNDHRNGVARHNMKSGTYDSDWGDEKILHDVNCAWRALAQLQTELQRRGAPVPRGAKKGNSEL